MAGLGRGPPGSAASRDRIPGLSEEGESLAVWRVFIDTGGTFTDCLAVDPEGRLHRAKVLSRTALFITRGFADLLAIGTQQRPALFALRIEKPAPLYETVVEVAERLAADGSVVVALDAAALEPLQEAAAGLVAQGFEAAAVAL